MADIFFEIGVMIIAATLLAALMHLLRQPMILAYIAAGVLIGPGVLGLIDNSATIRTLSEIGIAFLLFIVGMEIDMRRLRDTGKSIVVSGTGQVIVTLLLGLAAVAALGYGFIEAVYIAVALTFSSTMITIKLYADKKELDTLHGRIVLGILLVQDVIAILLLAVLPTIAHPSWSLAAFSLGKGAALFMLAAVSARFVIPWLFRFVAHSAELLFLAAVSWCLAFAGIAHWMGYSVAIGAFLAGVSLASTVYNLEIVSRVRSLRDFFATIFFVSLGMMLLGDGSYAVSDALGIAAVLSLLVVVGNPLIVIVLMTLLGHKARTAFLSGLAIAQISEFSLIVMALGATLGHVSAQSVAIVTMVAAVTITASTYLIKYDEKLYLLLEPRLRVFERLGREKEHLAYGVEKKKHDVVLCGYNRIGFSVLESLKREGHEVLVVDFNPELVQRLVREKQRCLYGDVGDVEVVERMNLKDADALISTVPTLHESLLLLRKAKQENPHIMVVLTANHVQEALRLYAEGADYVVMPHYLSGSHLAGLLEKFAKDGKQVHANRMSHLRELYGRKAKGEPQFG